MADSSCGMPSPRASDVRARSNAMAVSNVISSSSTGARASDRNSDSIPISSRVNFTLLRCAEVALLQQKFFDEHHCRRELEILVLLFSKAVAFVIGDEVPDGCAVFTDGGGHLLTFVRGDA